MLTSLYAALLGFWLAFLYLKIVKIRRSQKISLGDAGNAELIKARSVHGNFIETVPYALILIMFVEMMWHYPWLIHSLGIALVISRLLHYKAIMFTEHSAGKERFYAGVTTLTIYVLCGVLLLYAAIIDGVLWG